MSDNKMPNHFENIMVKNQESVPLCCGTSDILISYEKGFRDCFGFSKLWCPCGDVILADTEDWKIPMCYECAAHFEYKGGACTLSE